MPHTSTSTQNTPKGKHLFLVDGYGFVFRAYHVMRPLTRSDGTPTQAVYGFTNMLLKLRRQIEKSNKDTPEEHYMAVILDAGSKSFRNEIYDQYKANRPPAPEDLIPQFPLIREASEALNIATVEKAGYEADDIIATYVREAKENGVKVTIVSSDKDLMQLVDDNVHMFDAMKDKDIGPAQVEEKFGVAPSQVLDLLALMGDSADNIPGVPGIGPKTAAELLLAYGSLEGIFEHTSEITQKKRRETLEENVEQAKLSRELADLCYEVPDIAHFDAFDLRAIDGDKLHAFLSQNEFKALIARVEKEFGVVPEHITAPDRAKPAAAPTNTHYTTLKDTKALLAFAEKAKQTGTLSLLPCYDHSGIIFGYSLATQAGSAAFIAAHTAAPQKGQQSLFGDEEESTEAQESDVLGALTPLLENPNILSVLWEGKSLLHLLPHTTLAAIDDVMLMSYVADGTEFAQELGALAKAHLEEELPAIPTDKKQSLADLSEEDLLAIYAARADMLLRLHAHFKQQLFDEKRVTLYEKMERPLTRVLAEMEQNGIKLDIKELNALSDDFAKRMQVLEKDIHSLAGREFNVGSAKQLGEILFDEMGIQGGKKSKKSGAYGTGADILEGLAAEGHDIATKVMEWRMISKLRSTYTTALAEHINKQTGRVHTSFMMTVANTGRLSSKNPNLQNIPIRSEEGLKIRKAFIPEKGNKLISCDYSQIELRVLAHMADIGTLKTAFAEGKDIHALTASEVFGIPLEEVDSATRRKAKAINFGIIYGQSAFGLANGLGISRGDAKNYIEAYFKQYPGIRSYMDETIEFAKAHGFVKTLYGRKIYLAGIKSPNPAMRQFSERAAINAPLQGTSADIIKLAMVQLDTALKKHASPAKLLLQIHDELLLEVPEAKTDDTCELVKSVMEAAATLDVPLIADVHAGNNWKEIH